MRDGRTAGARTRRVATGSAIVVLVATAATLAAGAVLKQPCASGDWRDGRQYRRLCYSDVLPLYGSEQLTAGRLPFLDPCAPGGGSPCDEYPVLTMYLMRGAAWISHGWARATGTAASYESFYVANAVLLALCALLTSLALYRVCGRSALYFAVAPTLAIYAFMNWDLLAVALAAAATLAFVRRRDATAGVLIGLGAAAKLYPALLVVPFVAERLRRGERRGAGWLTGAAAAAFVVVNVPFAIAAPRAWSTFFRFNSTRPADWDSLWYVACQRLHGGTGCPWSARLLDVLSIVLLVAGVAVVWWIRRRRERHFARWELAFPVLVVFLLANKVYSPQYGVWLLPWFALALPNPWLFAAFEVTDIGVFVTRFTWFGRLSADLGDAAFRGYRGVPIGAFEAAVVARALVLIACIAAWTLRRPRREQAEVATDPVERAAA